MKYSKATDYALHTMLMLANEDGNSPINVTDLAEMQKISPTYLSKILTKLSKANLIKAYSGANGGYSIISDWNSISFLDIIRAIEGNQSIFECYVHDDPNCGIKKIMYDAETKLEEELASKTLGDIVK